MQPLADFDAVIVDAATDARHLDEMRQMGVNVIVAPRSRAGA